MLTSPNCITEIWEGVIYCISEGDTEFNAMRLWGMEHHAFGKSTSQRRSLCPHFSFLFKISSKNYVLEAERGGCEKQFSFKSPGKNREKVILYFIKIIVSFLKYPPPPKNNQIRFLKKLDLSLS